MLREHLGRLWREDRQRYWREVQRCKTWKFKQGRTSVFLISLTLPGELVPHFAVEAGHEPVDAFLGLVY